MSKLTYEINVRVIFLNDTYNIKVQKCYVNLVYLD